MAKTKISEYDAIAANNTDVNSINIAEGCAPSGINNAIRQVMADLKDFQQGTKGDAFLGPVSSSSLTLSSLTANRVLYTNGSKVVATSDNMQFDGTTTTLNALTVDAAFAANGGATLGNATGDALTINSSAVSIPNGLNFDSNTFVIDAGNNYVGVGTNSPTNILDVNGTSRFRQELQLNISGTVQSRIGISTYTGSSSILAIGNDSGVTANTIAFYNTGSERMRIDSSGNVGIGISNPSQKLHIAGNTLVPIANSYYCYTSDFGIGTPDSNGLQIFAGSGDSIRFCHRASGTFTERMRLDANGSLLVGTTSLGNTHAYFERSSVDRAILNLGTSSTVSNLSLANFRTPNGIVGSITVSSTSTAYVTSSDYRLKENIEPMTGALATVQALKPCTYNWKSDGSSGQGFIAHELQEVVPDCVTGEKDAVELVDDLDAEGKKIGTKEVPRYQGIDTSFLVATLTAAIQEQQAIITDLKSRIETLENK